MGQHDTQDPENLMQKELAKKRMTSTKVSEMSRAEFTSEYYTEYSKLPDWADITTHWLFNVWLHGQGEREWLTEEEKQQMKQRQQAHKKRTETLRLNKEAEQREKERKARERRLAAASEYKRIRKENKLKKENA